MRGSSTVRESVLNVILCPNIASVSNTSTIPQNEIGKCLDICIIFLALYRLSPCATHGYRDAFLMRWLLGGRACTEQFEAGRQAVQTCRWFLKHTYTNTWAPWISSIEALTAMNQAGYVSFQVRL